VDLATISLLALIVTIVLSCTSKVNPGALAIVFAWVIGAYLAPRWGVAIDFKTVLSGFPTELFLTLVGVTLLFSQAQANGTLEQVSHFAVRCCRGNAGLVPVMFFVLAFGIATIGAGNIASAALVAPTAMVVARKVNISTFLMTLMVAHGAVAGALSPFAPTGIIANGLLERHGIIGLAWPTFVNNLIANALAAGCGYLLFGGWRLFRRKAQIGKDGVPAAESAITFSMPHAITLVAIGAVITAVVGFHVHVGMAAFAAAILLTLLGAGDDKVAVKAMPWGVILMVCGVTVLTSLLERTGGLDLFTTLLVKVSTKRTVTGVVALVTGLVSVYSSTSGVVLPAFLPSVPGLVAKLGGGNPVAIASSIMIGGHLVDVSPLSTIGALCVASAPPADDRDVLFHRVLGWGLAMSVVGAIGCYLAFG
jgi:di/tricarboxylate transporter